MANRWADGLGRYGGTKSYMLNGSSGQAWAEVDGDFSLSSANPRTGTHCLRLGTSFSTQQDARRIFGTPLTEVFLGCAIYAHTLPTTEGSAYYSGGVGDICLFDLRDQTNNSQISIYLGTDGRLVARRSSTLLGQTVPIIGAGAYQHIEVYAKAGNGTAGALEIRVDEVTKLNLTGIDTVQTANVEFSQWAFGHNTNGGTAIIDFADFYCNDTVDDGSGCNSFIGDVKSGVLMVDADTAQADFSKSTGTVGYSLLNEKPPVDAGYIYTASSTARSDFGLQDGPANLSEILTIRPFVRAWKDDAGTATIAPNVLSGAVDGTVSDQPITTAAAYYDSNVPLDPNTGVPWTASGLNAAKHIVERIS